MAQYNSFFVRIKKDTPFLSELLKKNKKIVVYYEQSYHKAANDYIYRYYDWIPEFINYGSGKIAFVYLPMLLKHIDRFLQFNFPDSICEQPSDFSAEDFYKIITDSIADLPPVDGPMFLVSDPDNTAGYTPKQLGEDYMSFFCFVFDAEKDVPIRYALDKYPQIFEHGGRQLPKMSFHKVESSDTDTEDFWFNREYDDDKYANEVFECDEDFFYEDKEKDKLEGFDADKAPISKLLRDISERINQLYALGVPEIIIKKALSLPEPKPSRLIITEDFRLLLPDYNNREIVLNPLPKALYFFYLRHNEGVLFKHLRDHRSELFDLYSLLSPSEKLDRMNKSIDDLVDSTKNSVNVLCSRIKSAFASQFQDRLASQYYITGAAGEPKCIALDRKLVEDRSGVVM